MKATPKDELDYIRSLAESGATAPLLSGRFLAWWGAMITLAYLGHYSLAKGAFGFGIEQVWLMWLAVIALALIGQFIMVAQFPADKPGRGSAGNRADIIWPIAGGSVGVFIIGTLIGVVFLGAPPYAYNWSLPLVFAVYACGLMVTGHLAGNAILVAAAWLALATVGVTAAFAMRAEVYLVAAGGIFLTVFMPGLILFAREPRTVV
jgi:hypothetical protein